MQTSRRSILAGSALGAAGTLVALDQRPSAAATKLSRNPFRLGVASGDPWPDGFVIWTRLAQSPTASNGRGGMPLKSYELTWQVATDSSFKKVVRTGTATAKPGWGHAVRVTLEGLLPGREYWYRFRLGSYYSRTGRSVTAPLPGTLTAGLTMAQLCCANFQHGYFTAYRRAAEDRPDVVAHLGDYIYEYGRNTSQTRAYSGPECQTLANYRQRYAEYHAEPDLAKLHATSPFLMTFDDHEVDNNWAGETPDRRIATPFMERRQNAFRAWYENVPSRVGAPDGGGIAMYRRIDWGALASFHLLDTRQYRDDQPCKDEIGDCDERTDDARTMLGVEQSAWLQQGLAASTKRWDFLTQQAFFAPRRIEVGPDRGWLLDAWDGYPADRARVRAMMAGVRNPVVLTGDTHAAWANDIQDDAGNIEAVELACTSISSSGSGTDGDGTHPFLAANPHMDFYSDLRGYTMLTITPDKVRAAYRVIDSVRRPGAAVRTKVTYDVHDQQRGLDRVSMAPRTGRPSPSKREMIEKTLIEER